MKIDFLVADRTLVVILQGEVDHHTCVQIRQQVDHEYQKKRARNLVFDLEKVKFMDSAGIGMLMGRYRNVAICGGSIALINVRPETAQLIEISGVNRLMKIYASKEQALEALA
ncbi:STAS domain-containing protein [Sporanaerobium hydrogeniformans]|uniref:STAS domain-containing protein n=1 Tax=Sporanaerobium hydrogeniformans TaxID=3072179 RepID=UPI0026BD941D|nr:anti-sigma factor antagonist [Sporanaerobium hydrogeniformans]